MNKNYTIIKQEELKDINSKGTLLIHNKTNAKIVLFENDDENKMFCVGFRTPPKDDTGVPHIIEHSVLCGSRKYPVKEPFVELMKSSLNTFLNAMTFSDKTIYPVASCNDKDFQNLMDVYLDAVFYPNILTNEKIFKQEGWHYELTNKDEDITLNGVVYNEMKGAFSSPDSLTERETMNLLFPDTAYGFESGGHPDAIPTLTYENFKKFYRMYYHPSNSYIVLYGNFDKEEKLAYLDEEYLSKFDKIDPNSELCEQKPLKEARTKEVFYPVTKGQGLDKKTYLSYCVAFPKGVSQIDSNGMDVLTKVLVEANGSPLERALLEAGVGEVITGRYESGALQPIFTVKAKNAEYQDKEKFVKTIEDCLKKLVKEGLDKKALEASLNILEFKTREADYGGMSKGLIYAIGALGTWLYDDNDPFSPFDLTTIFSTLRENIKTDYYEKLIEKYLINTTHKGLVIARPSETLQEEKELKVKEKLQEFKKGLNDKDIEKIILETKELKEYQAEEDKKEDLDKIPLLKKEDLSYDIRPFKNKEYTVKGVKVVEHDYSTNKIAYFDILFNVKNVGTENVPYLSLLISMLGAVNTEKYSYLELEQETNIHTGGINYRFETLSKNHNYLANLIASGCCLYNKIDKALELIEETIFTSKFDNKDRFKEVLSIVISSYMNNLSRAGHGVAVNRAISYFDEGSEFGQLVNGIDNYYFVKDIYDNFDEKYEETVKKINELREIIFAKDNIMVSATFDFEGSEPFKKAITKFLDAFKDESPKYNVEIKLEKKNEGFKAPYDVNYCAIAGDYGKAGLPFKGSFNVLQNILSAGYLWKNVRVLGGAYGCMCSFGRETISFVSYRDPKIKETYDVYKGVIDYLDKFNADSEEMLKLIIGAVGSFDYPISPNRQGYRSFVNYILGYTNEDQLQRKKEIIDCTEEDIRSLKPYFIEVFKQNNVCTIGNEQKVEDNKELFEEVKNLLK